MPHATSFAPAFKQMRARSALALAALAVLSVPAAAAPFAIGGASTAAQTLNANETGSVALTGSLSVTGATVAVTLNGNNASVVNLGQMQQTGTGRLFRDNVGLTGIVITNGSLTNASALMQTADADVIQMNKTTGGVVLNNYGSMISLNASAAGSQAVDFTAVTLSANTVTTLPAPCSRPRRPTPCGRA